MKKNFGILVILGLFFFAGCTNHTKKKTNANEADTASKKIVIASADSDAQIWQFIADSKAAKEADLEIEVKEITGGPQLNIATVEGQADVNAFQSIGYLLSFNKDSKEELVPIATTYMEPMGIYSDKYEAVADIKEGALVALADNPANTARGLRLLESAGLIKLSADFDGGTGTPSDIIKNPKNLEFRMIDDTTGPRILQDVDLALISNTVAFEGGLNVLKDSIYKEEIDDNTRLSINVLVVKKERENDENLQKLNDLYHSQEVKNYIEDHFGGTKVDVQENIKKIWEDVQ